MIKLIQKLAETCASLNILVIAKEGGELSLTFIPTVKQGGDAALAKPFTLAGTPEELEQGLGQALASIAATRETLADQVEATNALLTMAAKESAEKGTKALKGKPQKALPAPRAGTAVGAGSSDGADPEEEDDAPAVNAAEPTAFTGSASSPAPAGPAINLFSSD